jgi:hypothetical protein
MSRSLVLAKPLKPPKELERFFGDPPLFGTERLEDYMAFLLVVATAAKPADIIVWILVRELVDTWWEIRRERLIKAEIIKQKQREYVAETMLPNRADLEKERQLAVKMAMPRDEDDEPSAFRIKGSEPIEKKQEDPISLLAKAYLRSGNDIECCDRRISALLNRRSALLREVDQRNESKARNADRACSDFVDAEFTEPVD